MTVVLSFDEVEEGGHPPALATSPAVSERPTHSEDYRCVHALGRNFAFTPSQAAVVRVLWEAWEDDAPDVGQETLLEASGSDNNAGRLRELFRSRGGTHPAWGLLIVPGSSRGSFRMALN